MHRIKILLCASALIVSLGCGYSPEARRDRYLSRGHSAFDRKDYTRALLEFRNAAQAMPKDAEPYYQIGVTALALGDLNTGVRSLQRALELNPKHSAAQLKLAQVMTAGNVDLLKEAKGRLEGLLNDSGEDPEVLNTLAFTELRLGDVEDGIALLSRALAKRPEFLEASALMARAKLMAGDAKGGEDALVKAVAAAPDKAIPKIVLGDFYQLEKRPADAVAQYRLALQKDPNSEIGLYRLGRVLLAQGNKTEAEESFKHLSSISSQNKQIYALFLFQEGRRDEAIREFERLAEKYPDDRTIRTQLIAAYRQVGRRDDAQRKLDSTLKKNPKDLDALAQRGEFYLQAGKYDQAEADFNRVRQLKPNSAEVHYLLAKFNQARGNMLTYRQEMDEALRLNRSLIGVRIEYAGELISTGSAKAALDILASAPGDQKKLLSLITQRNWALWSTGALTDMRQGIDEGLARERTPELLLQDAVWKLKAGKPAEARAAVEQVLKLKADDVRALSVLKQSYDDSKQQSLAIEKVKQYAAGQPKSAPVQAFLGRLLMVQGDRAGARAALTAAKAADPKSLIADLSLVQLDALERNWDAAADKLKVLLAADPKNGAAHLWLGNVEVNRGNSKAAVEHFRAAIESNPDDSQALNNLAYLLLQQGGNSDEALKYAQRAQELQPDNADFADTVGWILYGKGLYGPAIQQLERGAKNGNPLAQYHLAMAYAKFGKIDKGKTVFEAALRRNPGLPEADLARAVVNGSK
jgi:tetratricopeptide (TPR) repeat protein